MSDFSEGLSRVVAALWAEVDAVGEHHGPEHVQLDRCKWLGDSAMLLLTDGAELFVDVRQVDRSEFRVELDCLLEPGIELHTYETALSWLAAHDAELLARWEAHCLRERAG